MSRALVPALVATLFIVAVQLAVLTNLRVAGVVVMAVWLWPLAVGLSGSTALGLIVAGVGGLCVDAHAITPFGLTAVVGGVVAWVAARLGREGVGDLDSAAWWVTPILGAIVGLFSPALYVILGAVVLNFSLWRGSVLDAMWVNAVAFAVFARPLAHLGRVVTRLSPAMRR